MTTAADELATIKDPAVREAVLRVYNDPEIPTGPLGTWAIKFARWRLGDRPLYPCPPSAAPKVTLEGIDRVERRVRRLVDFRPRRIPPDEVERTAAREPAARRTADWNPAA